MYDLLIAGAGPAGLATALYAHRAGLHVAVTDPRPSPIDKACGEGLLPAAVTLLRELQVPLTGREFRGICYLDGERQVQARFQKGVGIGVRRTELQRALCAAVQDRGIHIGRVPVDGVRQHPDHVQAAGLSARYLVGADGLHSAVRRHVGLQPAPQPRTSARWGLRRHYAVSPWTDMVEVHWSEHAEAYVTPIGPALVGVALLTTRRAGFDEQLAAFPTLARRLSAAAAVTPARGAGPLHQAVPARVCGRVLLVGDAAGYIDALTGDGISVALRCARALVECVNAGRPQDYERRWRHLSRRYRLLTSALLAAAAHPTVRRNIVPAATRMPAIFAVLVNQIARG